MKKFIAGFVILFVFAITVPITADAQTCRSGRNYRSNSYNSRNYSNRNYRSSRYNSRNYSNRNYRTRGYTYQRPSFYRRHKNIIDIGVGTGGGALIGGILGGRRGAGYGALIGAGSGALYTYVLRPKTKRARNYRR